MGKTKTYLEQLSRQELLDLRRTLALATNVFSDKVWTNLLNTVEMQIIEIALVQYQRFEPDTIYHVVNALSK